MKTLLFDPGLSSRSGHNAALAEELARALAPQAGLHIAASVGAMPEAFRDLNTPVLPAFRIDGYTRYAGRQLLDDGTLSDLRNKVDEDLDALDLSRYGRLLMPTAYPLHLEALARRAHTLSGLRLTIGLLMPPEFWAVDMPAASALEQMMLQSVQVLSQHADCLFYCETGSYPFGPQRVSMPILLPPVSDTTSVLMERLARQAAPLHNDVRFGFFGAPFTSKGFEQLLAVASAGLPPLTRLVVRLPAGHADLCTRLQATGAAIDATSRGMSNADYLQEMAQVDVVLATYDPNYYSQKMSGIVPEAISLGRPVLVSDGCTALIDFLDRHAPGSFASTTYSVSGLTAAMALPAGHWQRLKNSANASSSVMRELKSARRYLALAGIEPPSAAPALEHAA